MRVILVMVLLAARAAAGSPADAVLLAAEDARKQPEGSRKYLRYLSLYHVPDRKDRSDWQKVLNFWINSLSRESELTKLQEVSDGLYRVDLRDYSFPSSVWDKLQDPYFTTAVKTKKTAREYWPGGQWNGKYYNPGYYNTQKEEVTRALAPWLDAKSALALVTMTRSKAPIVRADWWLVETSQQVDRKGTGYYDFLAVKNRAEFQQLVGLDKKLAEKLQREVRAIVSKSGVALHNRQIIRLQTITGGYWTTLDVTRQDGKRNAVRNLNGDYQHDAEEIYGTLPNGLFAFFLSDANGKNRQDSVPDNVASDGLAPGNDRRIHPGIGCVRCHVSGIQPINDWARKVYKAPVALSSPDYDKIKRLRRLYLGDLEKWIKRDQSEYAEVVNGLTGLKPELLARSFAKLHAFYREDDVTLDRIALEAGYKKADIVKVLKERAKQGLDPLLASLIQDEPESIVRDHFEEVFSLLMTYMKGYTP